MKFVRIKNPEEYFTDTVLPCVYCFPGKDVATNVEVYWPDGRSVARPLEPSDINSVLEIRYPKDEDEVTPTAEIEVHDRVILECSFLGNPSGISQHQTTSFSCIALRGGYFKGPMLY